MTQDPDQIRADIERTRAELSADVDTLNEKVNPRYVAQRTTAQVKGRARGMKDSVKDKVMGSMPSGGSGGSSSDPGLGDKVKGQASSAQSSVGGAASNMGDRASGAPDEVRARAEGNPLAAGLIAFGLGWLASSLLPATDAEQRAATQLKDKALEYKEPVQEHVKSVGQEVADNLREPAQQAAESVRSSAQDAADNVKGEAQSAKDDVAGQAKQSKENVQGEAQSDSDDDTVSESSFGPAGTGEPGRS